ncbi:HEAT repeat domain-containing protein [Embleya sp. NPDC059237]|uniref:HEAT repeat domain-containing protein n=1 Tax=Embleya sp. NPDC059237 TaxID=3346784 RepID=UPI0036A65EC6
MRSPEELDTIDWQLLYHAYGDGTDVPDRIRALYGDDADRADTALGELFNHVLHQGTVYPATVAAVPFLAHAAVHAPHQRAGVLALLAGAGGEGPVPRAGDQEEGHARVGAEVAGLLHLLGDDDPQVRRHAVRVARRASAQTLPAATRELAAAYATDPAPAVRAEALIVLTRIDPDPRARTRRLHEALADPVAAVRAVAALALLEQEQAPYPADLVAVLADAGGDRELAVNRVEFFPGIGDTDSRVAAVLAHDPDATATVARAWIAQGNVEGRGSRRAHELSTHWRGRENDTLALLAAALPHAATPWDLSELLGAVICWAPGATYPDSSLGDNLMPHALADATTAELAQLALGLLGDERLLTAIPDPQPRPLVALAARTRNLDHQRLALRHRNACPDELLATLTPHAARALLRDLTDLLRRRPTVALVRRFGDWGIRDTELLGLLARNACGNPGELATAATVAAARLGADPAPALDLLARHLEADWRCLEEAGRLGPTAAPLLPLVEGYLADDYAWARRDAAEAHWRITGDHSEAVPVLTDLAETLPLAALETLLAIGPPYPSRLRPRLLHWANTDRRVLTDDIFAPPTEAPMDTQLRSAATRMLT